MTTKANYEMYGELVIFTDKDGGAILCEDELWYPFRYFDAGKIDILSDEGYIKASSAYKMYTLLYT